MCDMYFPHVYFMGLDPWCASSETKAGSSMCDSCAAVAEKLHEDGRVKFWAALPGIFGLPEWEVLELKKEQELLGWCVAYGPYPSVIDIHI